jgi:signal transduction histidine kinase
VIENASKYNVPDGRIEVRVRGENGEAILEISNSGPKLDQDELAGLLEPFRRAAQQRVGTGNGLGLSIVRTIVAAHDGQLALNALADGGLRVTVKLPSTPEQPATGAVAAGGNSAIAASPLLQSEIRRSAN